MASPQVTEFARDTGTDPERRMRLDLAASYRLADHFGWSDVIWNHITARIPGPDEAFLLKPHGLRYDEVTASNLVKLDLDGNILAGPKDVNVTGFVIHSAIYQARADVVCVLHTHTRAGLAISCLDCGLLPLVNDTLMLHENVAYHEFEGISDDADERVRLAASLGDKPVLILRNHGLLTVGRSVAEAFMLMYYLDRACQTQLDVLQSGQAYSPPSAEIAAKTAAQYRDFWPGDNEWPALVRLADKIDPGYRD